MTILTKESDLLKFLNDKKKKNLDATSKHLYYHYNKIINTCILNTFNKLLNLEYTNHCVKLINILFWYLIEETKNIKLSMFLCDRAILLYTEYILMINNPNGDNKINLIEVKMFVYKKTLGPLSINLNKKHYYNNISNFCYLNTNIYIELFTKIFNKYIYDDLSKIPNVYKEHSEIFKDIYLKYQFTKDKFVHRDISIINHFIEKQDLISSLDVSTYINIIIILLYTIHNTKKIIEKKDKYIINTIEWLKSNKIKDIIEYNDLNKYSNLISLLLE